MSLKNAALLALIGTLLWTVVLALDFFRNLTGLLNDVVAMNAFLRSGVELFAGITLVVFFFSFHKAQSK